MPPRGKQYVSAEIAAVAKAYVNATNNPLRGADQRQQVFIADLLSKLEHLAPADLNPKLVTYHHRGAAVWGYLRNTVFKDLDKFIKALRIVYSKETSGATEQQKINMAVAIHTQKTKFMNYEYKNYDSTKEWRFYLAWLELKDDPKFQIPYSEIPGNVSVSNASDVARAHINRSTTENNTVAPDSSHNPYHHTTGDSAATAAAATEMLQKIRQDRQERQRRLRDAASSHMSFAQAVVRRPEPAAAAPATIILLDFWLPPTVTV
jgi:hypothetical protein